jgi:ABC-type Na+ efflux pump permease subunit
MSRVLLVAWRDFRQTVLKKAFLFAILGVPVLGLAVMGLTVSLIMRHEEPPLVGTIAVVDASGEVAEAARREFEHEQLVRERHQQMREGIGQISRPGRASGMGLGEATAMASAFSRGEVRLDLEAVAQADEQTVEALRQRVRDGDLVAAALITEAVLETPPLDDGDDDGEPAFELYVGEHLDADHTSLIERRLGHAIVRVRAAREGMPAEKAMAMLQVPQSDTRRLLEDGQETSESRDLREWKQMVPMAFMMLLWIATFTAGQHLMMSTIEEKSNRVMEVLLSAVSPLQLMAGKIIGQGGVGLLIVLIYASFAICGLVVFALLHIIDLSDLAYLAIYFFMAYFMIASVMAAVGSAVSDIREANTLLMPVMIILMFPLMLWLPITNAPNGMIATVFSFIPPAIPFAMILRVAADEPVPLWQIPLTIVWGYACVLAMVWMATKIFRVGVLMYGKPPSILELLKWVRYR